MFIISDKCLDVDIFKIFVHNIRKHVLKTNTKIITLSCSILEIMDHLNTRHVMPLYPF